jgi:UDP-4-amino-4,6-dideoxy-N-acetyl-beta-L-altrosamine N-acetyltransferase
MTENLQVRSMHKDDLDMVLAWRNHPEVRRFMLTQHQITQAEHTQWFMRVSKDRTRRLLIIQEQGFPIGCVQFCELEPGGVADWGFYARPDAAKGTGSKLGATALNYAFGQLKLQKVCAQVIDTNQASIRFHERLGFKNEGVLRDQKRMNNQYQTLISFGLLAHEWQVHTKGDQP